MINPKANYKNLNICISQQKTVLNSIICTTTFIKFLPQLWPSFVADWLQFYTHLNNIMIILSVNKFERMA